MTNRNHMTAVLVAVAMIILGLAIAPSTMAGLFSGNRAALPAASEPGVFTWTLKSDFRIYPNQANPNPDRYGNSNIWYYMQTTLAHDPSSYTLDEHFFRDIADVVGLEGWSGSVLGGLNRDYLPVVQVNTRDEPIVFTPGWTYPPGVIIVHPTSTQPVIVGWRSPLAGPISITGGVKDLNSDPGDGISWSIDKGNTMVAWGAIANGSSQKFKEGKNGQQLGNIHVNAGDLIYFLVFPNQTYYGDQTQLDVTITLDTRPPTSTPTPIYTPDGDWIFCAKQYNTCNLPGTRLVRYGANGSYLYNILQGSFVCSSAFTGDPIPGATKYCHYDVNPNASLPTSTSTRTRTPTRTSTPTRTATYTPTNTSANTPTATATVKACTKKPQPLQPNNGAIVSGPNVVLKWSAVACADTYSVRITRVSDGQVVVNKSGRTTPRYAFKKGIAGESYDWQVRACTAGGCSLWTTAWRFAIQP